jgi:hypothetical protein
MRQPPTRLVSGLAAIAIGLTACGVATAAGPAHGKSNPPPGPAHANAGAPPGPAHANSGPPPSPDTCPPGAPTAISANPWPPARAQLAPPGATSIRLCRYSSIPSRLVRSVLIGTRGTVATLVDELDRLPPFKGSYACPNDDGSQIVALLAYPNARRVTVAVHLRGCSPVANGNLVRTALGQPGQDGPKLLAQLERLTS